MAQVPQLMSTGQFGRMGLFLRGELGNWIGLMWSFIKSRTREGTGTCKREAALERSAQEPVTLEGWGGIQIWIGEEELKYVLISALIQRGFLFW